jgi:coenzyme F420 hydrogenase subunit beta
VSAPCYYLPVAKRGLCCGCGACTNLFQDNPTRMIYSADGFLRPVSEHPLSAAEKQILERICPGVLVDQSASPATGKQDPVWGPILNLYTGHANDAEIRFRASSGGGLSALALYLLESKTIDGVLHVRSASQDPLRNEVVLSRDRAELLEGAGSRYGPSAPLVDLDDQLNPKERYAFIGKPCDAAALRQLCTVRPELRTQFPMILSFMCAGVPSEFGSQEILGCFGVNRQDLVSFRYRGHGWPGTAEAKTNDGKEYAMDYDKAWGTILNRHLQWRCKICPDGIGELADAVFADGWYLDSSGYPDFSERPGRSIVIVRTAVGQQIIDQASANGYLNLKTQSIDYLDSAQPFQQKRKSEILMRLLAMRTVGRRPPRFLNLHLMAAMRKSSPTALVRSYLATLVRLFRKRPS